MLRFAAVIECGLALAACAGPLVPVAKVDDGQAVELQKTVRVFPPDQTPKTARALGSVTATSCKNKMWDKDPTEEDATNQLSLYSRGMGGNAVGNLVCEPVAGTSLATNCWSSITCRGTAINLDAPAQSIPAKKPNR